MTVVIGGQLFGLPIHKVHDVFVPESMTRVPLSAPEIAGVLNKQITSLGAILTMRSPRSKTQDYYEALNAQAGLLGAVPHAVGLDADQRIYAAYEPIAQRIAQSL